MSYFAVGHSLAGDEEFRIDIVQVPFERFALEIIAKFNSTTHIPEITLSWKEKQISMAACYYRHKEMEHTKSWPILS